MSREGTGLLSELPSSRPSHCVRPNPSWPVAHGDALVAMEFTQVGAGSGAEALQGATPHFADTQLQTVKSLRLPRGRRGFTERWRRAPAKRDSVQGAGIPGRGGEKGFVRGAEAWLSPSPNGVTVGGISEPPSPQPWEWE